MSDTLLQNGAFGNLVGLINMLLDIARKRRLSFLGRTSWYLKAYFIKNKKEKKGK
jgi:hypothetical protein